MVITANLQIVEEMRAVPSGLAIALDTGPSLPLPVLVNVGVPADLPDLVRRCDGFARAAADTGALIITIVAPAADTDLLDWHMAAAGAWAFTRHAALAWAPRRVRLNAIGYGVGPPEHTDPVARGRSAGIPAPPASIADVVRTVHAMAGWRSMTGQFIRLGGI